jgi:hypothetical protein
VNKLQLQQLITSVFVNNIENKQGNSLNLLCGELALEEGMDMSYNKHNE